MLSGSLGTASLGQFVLGLPQQFTGGGAEIIAAPADRTFHVPQLAQLWYGKKTSSAILNFTFDWSQELRNEDILTSKWTLESADLSLVTNGVDSTNTLATCVLSGGIADNIYNVTNTITTQSGLIENATFRLFVNNYNL